MSPVSAPSSILPRQLTTAVRLVTPRPRRAVFRALLFSWVAFAIGGLLGVTNLEAQDPDQRKFRTRAALQEAAIFGDEEIERLESDFEFLEFDTEDSGEGVTSAYAAMLGNVLISGPGFELHADMVGIFIAGFDEENRPLHPRVLATGNILLVRGDQSFRAETFFFDVDTKRAVFTEMRLRIDQKLIERLRQNATHNPQRSRDILESFGEASEVPVGEDRVESATTIVFAARELTIEDFEKIRGEGIEFTTCEFGHPHWALEAKSGQADARKEVRSFPGEDDPGGWLFELDSVSLRAGPVSIPLLPGVIWDSRWGRYIPLRSVSYSSSGKFGNRVDTLWNGNLLLPSALSREMDLGLRLDYLSERGTGYGADLEWGRDPLRWSTSPDGRVELFGTGQWWAIDDRGLDRNTTQPTVSNRYRSRFHQRLRLQSGTWIDFEYASESDSNFLDEFFEEEARGEKTPENVIFLRHPVSGAGQVSMLYQRQVVDYRTVIERLPEMRFAWVEEMEPTTQIVFDGQALIGEIEDRPAEDLLLPNRDNQRADVRLLASRPTQVVRGVRFRPFIEGRYTFWDKDLLGEEEDRVAWAAGGTLSSRIWRTFAAEIPSLNIHGLRHVVDFDVAFESLFDTNVKPSELIVIDELEQIVERESVTLALFQRLFTQARTYGRTAERGYAVRSLVDSRLEIEWFPDKERDNAGEAWGPMEGEFIVNPVDKLGMFVDGTYDYQDGDLDEVNSGLRWHDPRAVAFEISSRQRRHRQDSLVVGGRWWGSEKYEFGAFSEIDLRRNKSVNQRYEVVRNFHRFSASFTIELDEGEDNTTFRVNFGPRDLLGSSRPPQ